MPWSASRVESWVRRALVPTAAVVVFVVEASQDEPSGLVLTACVTLMLGQPVAALLDRRAAERDDPPRSPADQTGDPSS